MSDEFRRGFLYGMASLGCVPDDYDQLVKRAGPWDAAKTTGGYFGQGLDLAAAAAVGLPLAAGALGGVTLAQFTRPSPAGSIEDLNDNETVRAVRQQTRAVARRLRARYGPDALKAKV